MVEVSDLAGRNRAFAGSEFRAELSITPSGSMTVIGCVDPRVDPAVILGLEQGEAAVIRNVGGRLTPGTLRQMGMLTKVSAAHRPPGPAPDWNLVLLHHTDCGMHDIAPFPELLAEYFEIPESELDGKFATDPYRSVVADVTVATDTLHGGGYFVSGLVYDVATGLVEIVVPPTPLRMT